MKMVFSVLANVTNIPVLYSMFQRNHRRMWKSFDLFILVRTEQNVLSL